MNIVENIWRLLIFCLFIEITFSLKDSCESRDTTANIDISKSKITKNTLYEYRIENFHTLSSFEQNEFGEIIYQGNFSRLTLFNKALNKQYNYHGTQMIFRIPSTHFYAENKSADAEIQIIYELEGTHTENKHKIIKMTQLYLITKYLSGVSVSLCSELKNENNKNEIDASKLLKIVEKMPVLMYQGSKNVYPCRNDVLCMVRKEFAQISSEDLSCVKAKFNLATNIEIKKHRYTQKILHEVPEANLPEKKAITGNENEL